MNGGTGSTLSVRSPITRPVSFHSLADHQRNSPALLSPHSHRRPRTPRSSPLTGPALSPDQVDSENKDDEGDQKPRYRPNRISSTPDMAARVQSLYGSDTASLSSPYLPQPSTSSTGILFPLPPIPKFSGPSSSAEDDKEETEDGSKLRSLAKRLSSISTSSLGANDKVKADQKVDKRRSSYLPHSASMTSLVSTSSSSHTTRTDKTSQAAPPIPTIPRWALNAMREEAGMANRNMKYGHGRGSNDELTPSSSLPPLPNQPIPRGVCLPDSGLSTQPFPPSVSRDPTENWMSMTDSTPKFSRLGLRGEGVVMPAKRESLAKMRSANSIRSTKSMTTASQSTGTRSDIGVTTKTESSPAIDSADPKVNPKEKDSPRKRRHSLADSLRAKIPKIIVPSSGTENVPPLPSSNTKSKSTPTSVKISSDLPRKTLKTSASRSSDIARKSATMKRDSTLAAINGNQRSSSSLSHTYTEHGRKSGDVKPQDTQKTRARGKSIKQIVMRITTSPTSAGKMKLTAIHDSQSTPVVVSDTLMPLDPPPGPWFRRPANFSVPSLPSTNQVSEVTYSRGDVCDSKKFKNIRKRWNAVFGSSQRLI
jgi:hypothetical protein